MCGSCITRIINIGGGTVDFSNLTPLEVTQLTQAIDLTQFTPAQLIDLCQDIQDNCDVGVALQFNGVNGNLELVDGQGDVLSSLPIPQNLLDADGDTGFVLNEGGAAAGGDRIDFMVDGNVVGSVEYLAGGLAKWNLADVLDPILFVGSPTNCTIAQANVAAGQSSLYVSDGTDGFAAGSWIKMENGVCSEVGNSGVDLNTHVGATQATPYAAAAPVGAPAAPDNGDVFVQGYDGSIAYWIAAGGAFSGPADIVIPMAGGDSIMTADLTANGPHTQSFNDHGQTWNNLGSLNVDQTISAFPGIFGSTSFTSGSFTVDANGVAGVSSNLDVQPNTVRLNGTDGISGYGFESDAGVTRMYYEDIAGAAGPNQYSTSTDGHSLDFSPAADLQVDGDPGVAGQVLSSNGPDLPPTWQNAAAGGDNLQTADLAVQVADRDHDFGGFSQTWDNLVSFDVSTNQIDFLSNDLSRYVSGGGDDLSQLTLDVTAFEARLQALNDGVGYDANVRLVADATGHAEINHSSPGVGQDRSIRLNADGVSLAFAADDDLKVNTDPGASGQVLSSNGPGLPPTWETAGVDTNLLNDDLSADGGHTHSFNDFGQTWNALGGWNINQALSAFPGFYGTFNLDTGGMDVDAFSNVGTANLDVKTGDIALITEAGTEEGGFELTGAAASAKIFYNSTNTGSGENSVELFGDRIDISFGTSADLHINGDPGTAGQVLSSNGPDLPPTWETVAGGSSSNYASAALVADGSYTHDWSTFNQTENFTSGSQQRNFINGFNGHSAVESSVLDRHTLFGPNTNTVYRQDNADWDITATSTATGDSTVVAATTQLAMIQASDSSSGLNVMFQANNAAGSPQLLARTNGVASGTAVAGQVATLVNAATGEIEFQAAVGSQNFANANLTLDANRVHDLDGNDLLIEDSTSGLSPLYLVDPAAGNSRYGASGIHLNSNQDELDLVVATNKEFKINGDVGAAGEVFTSNGPNVAPTWQAAGSSTPTIISFADRSSSIFGNIATGAGTGTTGWNTPLTSVISLAAGNQTAQSGNLSLASGSVRVDQDGVYRITGKVNMFCPFAADANMLAQIVQNGTTVLDVGSSEANVQNNSCIVPLEYVGALSDLDTLQIRWGSSVTAGIRVSAFVFTVEQIYST